MHTIVHRIRLKPDASPEDFERWVREVDYATCPKLPGLVSFAVHRIPGGREYFEVIAVDSPGAFEKDMTLPHFRALVERFETMAEVVEETSGERVEPGYHRG